MNLVLGNAKPATPGANTKKVKVTFFIVPEAIASQTMRDYEREQTEEKKQNSNSILGTVLGHWIARAHAVNQKPYTSLSRILEKTNQACAQHMFLFRASHAPTLLCKQSDQALNQQLFFLHAPDLLIKAQYQKSKQQKKEIGQKMAHAQDQALQQDAFDQKRQEQTTNQNPTQTSSTPIDTVDFGKKARDNVYTVTMLHNTLSRLFYKSEH